MNQMWSLIFRNLFFTVLQPGMVVGVIPYWILANRFSSTFKNTIQPFQYIGIFIFTIGTMVLFYCIIMFILKGKGTISPVDPTKKLVVAGLYKFSRNPMYMGAMLMLIGEALFFNSGSLCIYTLIVFIAFNLFIILHEEPRLKKDFGTEYDQYMKAVRRWL